MSNNLSLEDLVEEFLQYCKNGESPDISEFANMYPEHKEELLDILPLLRDLEDLGYKRNTQYVDIISSVPNLTGSDYQLIRKSAPEVWELCLKHYRCLLTEKLPLNCFQIR